MEYPVAVDQEQLAQREPTSFFDSSDREGVTVLTLVGEHDMASAQALESRIDGEIGRGRNVVVSLEETVFVDSGVVAALYRSQSRMSARGLRLVLHCSPNSVVHRLLQISSLIGVVASADTLAAAVELART